MVQSEQKRNEPLMGVPRLAKVVGPSCKISLLTGALGGAVLPAMILLVPVELSEIFVPAPVKRLPEMMKPPEVPAAMLIPIPPDATVKTESVTENSLVLASTKTPDRPDCTS